jgi:acetylglutamate kinase
MQQPVVVKISGHELDDPEYVDGFVSAMRGLTAPKIVVHGGGKEITNLQRQMGVEPVYVNGVRVTDGGSLALVQMVLCGTINKRLVLRLLGVGVEALGVSGIDRGLVRAEQMKVPGHDMAFTGIPTQVRGDLLLEWLKQGVTPVIAPICLGEHAVYNVNADHVAGAVAAAVGAERAVFLTNVPGVMVEGQVRPVLTDVQARVLIELGVIFGGMIPKVENALAALESGVGQVVITNLEGLRTGGGTIFRKGDSPGK